MYRRTGWVRCVCGRLLATVLAAVGLVWAGSVARADGVVWHLDPTRGLCGGQCGVSVQIGEGLHTGMRTVFGFEGFAAPWDWDLTTDYLISASVSRRLLSISYLDIEPEIGIGQRFGHQHETEFWAAIYFRWTWFPWNDHLKTTVAISTGLNWATGVSDYEERRGEVAGGAQLLHYLSPEITLALPDRPDWELVFRLHHRSGGGALFGDTWLFKGVTGGAQFATLGVRHRF